MKKSSSPLRRTPPKRRPPPQSSDRSLQHIVTVVYLATIFMAGVLVILFFAGRLTVGGVPSSVILSFLQDDIARGAYFSGDKRTLHDRLDELGIEEQMKEFYRAQIPNEVELDQYIHQILYDQTGYVGEAYRVDAAGFLILKD